MRCARGHHIYQSSELMETRRTTERYLKKKLKKKLDSGGESFHGCRHSCASLSVRSFICAWYALIHGTELQDVTRQPILLCLDGRMKRRWTDLLQSKLEQCIRHFHNIRTNKCLTSLVHVVQSIAQLFVLIPYNKAFHFLLFCVLGFRKADRSDDKLKWPLFIFTPSFPTYIA
jgi:hypothetical protein